MGQLADIKEEVLGALRSDPRFLPFQLAGEFAGENRDLPVRTPTLTVGIDSIEAEPAGLGDYLGDSEAFSHAGSAAVITLRFDFCLPQNRDIAGAHAIFEALCEIMASRFGAPKVWCEPARSDRQALATTMTARATVKAYLSQSESAPFVGGIVIKRRSEALGSL